MLHPAGFFFNKFIDINECDRDPCTEDGAVCENTPGSYTCTCPEELYNNGNKCYGIENNVQSSQCHFLHSEHINLNILLHGAHLYTLPTNFRTI